MGSRRLEAETTAEAYLELLKDRGIDVFLGNAGTGTGSTAIISAARATVPSLMSAGRTPITEEGLPGARDLHIHWAQESFDQAAMLREYVKWDYELRTPVQLESVVDRAFELMH